MFRIFFLLLFVVYASSINAQQSEVKRKSDSVTIGKLLKHDALTTVKSIGHAFTRPLDWKDNDYLKLGGLIGGTILLSAVDDEINAFFNRQQSDFPKAIRDFGWYFGSPQNYFIANVGLYGFGLFTRNEQIRRTSILIISSSFTTGVITSLIKSGAGRARPSAGFGNWEFEPFSSEGGFHSFPSGHSSLSITAAHAIAKQFDNTWVKIGIYSIGAIPPISRLVDNEHWLTDIAFSTALSIIVVDSIDKFLSKSEAYSDRPRKKDKISWNVSFGTNKIGVTGTF